MPHCTPDLTSESVRTLLLVPSCPMCGTLLQGRQTVCSAKCRVARSRQKATAIRQGRDAKIRRLLREVFALLGPENEPSS